MIKIGNTKIETYPISQCNLKHLVPYVYITPIPFTNCPICGQKLNANYVYGVQISENECIKLLGNNCIKCNSLFSRHSFLFSKLENVRVNKELYTLKDDYYTHYDSAKYSNIFNTTTSVYKQFVLCRKKQIITYTIVYDEKETNEKDNVIHYTSEIAHELLTREKNNEVFITINNYNYAIVNVKNAKFINAEIIQDINETLQSKVYFNNELPQLTTQHTLFVYNGNIKCHKKHHISEFKAMIEIPEFPPIGFYVEYCYECNKFLIKHSDYSIYLKRFKFFPLKVKILEISHNDFFRADKSPLLLNGYTVNSKIGYTSQIRQSILAAILDHGIMERRKVLDYLEMFIRDNRGDIATQKYIADKNFVLNHRLNDFPVVKIFSIARK